MSYLALERINGFDPEGPYRHWSDLAHYLKHAFRPNADLTGLITANDYLDFAKKVGKSASRGEVGTEVARRGNNDLIVYAENALTRSHSKFGGVFMVVRDRGLYGQGKVVTIFSPKQGRAYFTHPDQRRLM